MLFSVQNKTTLLNEELALCEIIADRHHSNYYAWNHRIWSMQYLLPDFSFQNFNTKAQKPSFFEVLYNKSFEIVNHPVSECELLNLNNYEITNMYFIELDNNFKWVSSHVSDYSGLHFRTFLLTEILSYMYNFLTCFNRNNYQSDVHNLNCNFVPSIISCGKSNLTEFLTMYNFDQNQKKTIDNYILKLEKKLTLVDIALFLIVAELKSNISLSLVFPNHEAVWNYRKFLIYSYMHVINCLDSCSDCDQIDSLHQDQNGIPCKKDFKFDYENEMFTFKKHSNLFNAFFSGIINSEKKFLSQVCSTNEYTKTLVRKYSHWLENSFRNN